MLRAAGITGGYDEFNQWCVRQRRGLPVGEVLAEWREANGETRHRMTQLGRDAPADSPRPALTRPACRPSTTARSTPPTPTTWLRRWPRPKGQAAPRGGSASGRFALTEQDAPVKTWTSNNALILVHLGGLTTELPAEDFVAATVGRLPPGYPIDPTLR